MEKYTILIDAVVNGKKDIVIQEVQTMLDMGDNPQDIIANGLTAAMKTVGEKMECGDMYIPEVLFAAKAMDGGMDLLKPLIGGDELNKKSKGKVVLGTVQGDIHSLGKNLVALMLSSAGYNVIDVGEDVSPERFIEMVKKENADLLGLSCLMTTTMLSVKNIIAELEKNNLRQSVKVMIGGAPVTQEVADLFGADGFAENANAAVEKAGQLINRAVN